MSKETEEIIVVDCERCPVESEGLCLLWLLVSPNPDDPEGGMINWEDTPPPWCPLGEKDYLLRRES